MNRSALAVAFVVIMATFAGSAGSAGTAPTRVARLNGSHQGVYTEDPDGRGSATITLHRDLGKICYDVRYERIKVFHIDIRRNTDRELVTELFHEAPTPDRLRGCRDGIKGSIIRRLREHPRRFYLRAAEYHGGDIAGTLRRP